MYFIVIWDHTFTFSTTTTTTSSTLKNTEQEEIDRQRATERERARKRGINLYEMDMITEIYMQNNAIYDQFKCYYTIFIQQTTRLCAEA